MAAVNGDREALEGVARAFGSRQRPEHFTNYSHCEECAEHDELLRSRNLDTLAIEDVGNVGWDPICFITPEGFAYYLPALARLTLDEPTYNYGWLGNQFFWHLISNGPGNDRYVACTPVQRKSVADFIKYLIDSRAGQLDEYLAADDALRAYRIWNGDEAA